MFGVKTTLRGISQSLLIKGTVCKEKLFSPGLLRIK